MISPRVPMFRHDVARADAATIWARDGIAAKNTLTAIDAKALEQAFERRLSELAREADPVAEAEDASGQRLSDPSKSGNAKAAMRPERPRPRRLRRRRRAPSWRRMRRQSTGASWRSLNRAAIVAKSTCVSWPNKPAWSVGANTPIPTT
jgi:hypothetical protein